MTFSGHLKKHLPFWIIGIAVCVGIGGVFGYVQLKKAARDLELRSEIRTIGIQYLTFEQEYQRSPTNFKELETYVASKIDWRKRNRTKLFA